MIMRTSSGVELNRIEQIIPFTATDLPEPVVPATSRCGIFARSTATGAPAMSLPSPMVSFDLAFCTCSSTSTSLRYTVARVLFGTSMPTEPLPGIGATMRTRSACSDIARSFDSAEIFDSLVPGAGTNSYIVTTGPGWISATLPLTP